MWLSSDVGTPADELAASWADQGWDCSGLSNVWWYTDEEWQPELRDWRKPGIYVHAGEPESPFKQRLENFKAWLLARPEARIAVVAHWGSIYGLTGPSTLQTVIRTPPLPRLWPHLEAVLPLAAWVFDSACKWFYPHDSNGSSPPFFFLSAAGKSLENCEALELRLEQFQDLNIFVTD
jgi:hypothetical protein